MNLKKNYAEFRIGLPIIAPLLAISNFILLAYNFTALKDVISIELFAIIFVAVFVGSMVLLGKTFRNKQQPTDITMSFERHKKQALMFRLLLENSASHFLSTDPRHKEIQESIDYLKKIEDGTI